MFFSYFFSFSLDIWLIVCTWIIAGCNFSALVFLNDTLFSLLVTESDLTLVPFQHIKSVSKRFLAGKGSLWTFYIYI